MNTTQAIEEARRRWGDRAAVWSYQGAGRVPHFVGFACRGTSIPFAAGEGYSFEEAFAHADKHRHYWERRWTELAPRTTEQAASKPTEIGAQGGAE